MNIYQRLNEVRKQVAYIQKDKQVTGQGYMAITHDAVTSAVREHLISNGVIVVPSLVDSAVKETGTTTSKGVPIIRLEARFDVSFVNMDEPTDKVTLRIESHALDQGDKAPGKATSYATKYAMLKVFSIETGEEEEERLPAKGNGKLLAETITPTSGAWDAVASERREFIRRIGDAMVEMCQENKLDDAYTYLYVENRDKEVIDNNELLAVWEMLKPYSKQRSALKKMRQTRVTQS